MSNKSKILNVVIIFFLSMYCLNAQVKILKIEINPLNRALIYFNSEPKYSSRLSDDKMKVTITVPNSILQISSGETHSSGIIQSIYCLNKQKNTDIIVGFKDKRGYTVSYLPYSRALMIESVNWGQVSTAEDAYRSGLMAEQDGIYSEAKDSYINAVRGQNANAAAYLGFTLMKEGKIEGALDAFLTADKFKSNLSDIYAGLSQVYKIKNDKSKSGYYMQIFANKTGIYNPGEIKINSIKIDDVPEDSLSLLYNSLLVDTINTNKNDSANKAQKSVITDTLSKPEQQQKSMLPGWLNSTLFYVGLFTVLMILTLYTTYRKWRKNQLKYLDSVGNKKTKPEKTSDFMKEFAKAQEAGIQPINPAAAKASKLYKNVEGTNTNKKNITKKMPMANKPGTEPESSKTATQQTQNAEDIQKLASAILKAHGGEKHEATERKTAKSRIISAKKRTRDIDSKKDLALRLQQEKLKNKEQNLSKINDMDLSEKKTDFTNLAKKLGLEKGSLETKKNLSELQNDKAGIEKLAARFKGKDYKSE